MGQLCRREGGGGEEEKTTKQVMFKGADQLVARDTYVSLKQHTSSLLHSDVGTEKFISLVYMADAH